MRSDQYPFLPHLVQQVLQTEARLHPLARPVDYYKLLLQSVMGPGHIISDIAAASQSIAIELGSIRSLNPPFVQDIDSGPGFIRLDIGYLLNACGPDASALEQGCMSLAKAMSRSALSISGIISMQDIWQQFLPLTQDLVSAEPTEWSEVSAMAAINAIPSHSACYKKAYAPHYRVLLRSEFVKGLLK